MVSETILTVMFIAIAVFASAFPIAYFILPWNSTPQGRAIMHFAIAMSLMLVFSVLFQFWQPEQYWHMWLIHFVILGYGMWASGYRTFVLFRDIRSHWTPPKQPEVDTDFAGHPYPREDPPESERA